MIIPVDAPGAPAPGWVQLDAAAKRERLLAAATDVFSRRGLDAPMSEVADAAGAGVASVYRIFPSKDELLAALVVRRQRRIEAAAREALARPGTRWDALVEMLTSLVGSADEFMSEARAAVADHPEVVAARSRAWAAMDEVLDAARTEGRLRADATMLDLRLTFASVRTARRLEPRGWERMLQLMIDALDGHRR